MVREIDYRDLTEAQKRKVLEKGDYVCVYCFGDADQVDHILPWSYKRNNGEDNLVACCWLCNIVGGNKVFSSFRGKQKRIQELRYAYIKKRPIAIWTKTELKPMGRVMKEHIKRTAIIVASKKEMRKVKRELLEMELCVLTGEDRK